MRGTEQRIQSPYDQEGGVAKPCTVEYTRKELGTDRFMSGGGASRAGGSSFGHRFVFGFSALKKTWLFV